MDGINTKVIKYGISADEFVQCNFTLPSGRYPGNISTPVNKLGKYRNNTAILPNKIKEMLNK